MKQFFSIACMLLVSVLSKAQLVTPAVINSGGLSATVNNIYFDFNLGESFTSTIGSNHIVTQGLLQPDAAAQSPLPVKGLLFNAKRINSHTVELSWSTQQEINNLGFYLERKKENEIHFTDLGFVPSKAVNGNAVLPLQYQYADDNNYSGKTYYRLRQKDIDGKETYSDIKVAEGNKTNIAGFKVWPVPAIDKVNVLVSGIDKPVQLQLLDVQGKLIKTYSVKNEEPLSITGIAKGIYVLRLSTGVSSVVQKIVMQ